MLSAAFASKIKKDALVSEVASAMCQTDSQHAIDLETGEVISLSDDNRFATDRVIADDEDLDLFPNWVQDAIPTAFMMDQFPDRYLRIQKASSRELVDVMKAFSSQISDVKDQKRLLKALDEPNAAFGFRKELSFHTGYKTKWLTFRLNHFRKKARKWLKKERIV